MKTFGGGPTHAPVLLSVQWFSKPQLLLEVIFLLTFCFQWSDDGVLKADSTRCSFSEVFTPHWGGDVAENPGWSKLQQPPRVLQLQRFIFKTMNNILYKSELRVSNPNNVASIFYLLKPQTWNWTRAIYKILSSLKTATNSLNFNLTFDLSVKSFQWAVMTWVILSCFSVLGLSLGGEHNSTTRAECLRVCVVYRFISACPACGKRSGGNEEVPWGRSYSSSYTNSYNKRSRCWRVKPGRLAFAASFSSRFCVRYWWATWCQRSDFEDLANWRCQQRASHGKQQQKKLCAQHLYISVSICVTGWKWSSVHAYEYVGHWTPTPCGLGEVKGWLGL